MSRQKGSRQRPVADRTRYREQFSRRSQRPTAAPAAIIGEPISRRRRWAAALGATFRMLIVNVTLEVTPNASVATTVMKWLVAVS